MLYGCCVNLLPKTLDRIGLEYAGRLKRLGYDYIELPLNELAQLSEQEFRDARTVLEELDLQHRSGIPERCWRSWTSPAAPATTLCPPAFRSPAPTLPPERS